MTRVAIVGGGAAGLGAARDLIRAGARVTIFESAPGLGGNCVAVQARDKWGFTHRVDAGVSDFNRHTFCELTRLIEELGLETRPISNDADFVGRDRRSLLASTRGEWRFGTEIADPAGLQNEIERFRLDALQGLENPRFATWTAGRFIEYLQSDSRTRAARRIAEDFRRFYLRPRTMGCFPMPDGDPDQVSLIALLGFWRVHGLIGDPAGDRRSVVGGMHRYIEALEEWIRELGGRVLCGTRVLRISRSRLPRSQGRVTLHAQHGVGSEFRERFDHVILTCHASQALGLLENPSPDEEETLEAFPWQTARVVAHHDARVLGEDRQKWGAFNYSIPEGAWPQSRPTITFYPNKLGSLPSDVPDTFISLNPAVEPRPELVIQDRKVLHPVLDGKTASRAQRVDRIQGQLQTWFAGSHLRAPAVHESALKSGQYAAEQVLAKESAGEAWRAWVPAEASAKIGLQSLA